MKARIVIELVVEGEGSVQTLAEAAEATLNDRDWRKVPFSLTPAGAEVFIVPGTVSLRDSRQES